MYLHADMRLKRQALMRIPPLGVKPFLYKPNDKLLSFLVLTINFVMKWKWIEHQEPLYRQNHGYNNEQRMLESE